MRERERYQNNIKNDTKNDPKIDCRVYARRSDDKTMEEGNKMKPKGNRNDKTYWTNYAEKSCWNFTPLKVSGLIDKGSESIEHFVPKGRFFGGLGEGGSY